MGFSGVWVIWSLLGAPGEKKRENQMYLQDYLAKFSKSLQNFAKNQRFSQKSTLFFAKIRKFHKNLRFFANFATFSKNQLDSFEEVENCCKMRTWLQHFGSI